MLKLAGVIQFHRTPEYAAQFLGCGLATLMTLPSTEAGRLTFNQEEIKHA